jgi:hypothetical protein
MDERDGEGWRRMERDGEDGERDGAWKAQGRRVDGAGMARGREGIAELARAGKGAVF